jgi:hypothetical protein
MAELVDVDVRTISYDVDVRTISYHLREVYVSGELTPETTLQKIWRVQPEGNRQVSR